MAEVTISTRPFIAIYVAWHPAFAGGTAIATALYKHFRRDLYENVAGGAGLSVLFRSEPVEGSSTPLPIDLEDAETSAVIVLVETNLLTSTEWVAYVRSLANDADTLGLRARVFPVSIEHAALAVLEEQAVRWDTWIEDTATKMLRLKAQLAYQFCRMLRLYLAHLERPEEREDDLGKYLQKVQVFLSHSKHDSYGEKIALEVGDLITNEMGLASFFDVRDIPSGLRFGKVLMAQVRVSAIVAIHTDSFSSREWCRKEIIEAKLHHIPLVIADAIDDIDERGFPYMGNVPTVRIDPTSPTRLSYVVARLIDEVLKDFLWRCRTRVESIGREISAVVFLPRPPELISLSSLSREQLVGVRIVYPDPPIGAEERSLFATLVPQIRLQSLIEWLAEQA